MSELESINVNPKTDEFFIAICKDGVHSYVALGVKNPAGETQILASVGKISKDDSVCRFVFDAAIKQERVMYKSWFSMNYKAYAITWQHYLEFLTYMQRLQACNDGIEIADDWRDHFRLAAFQPVGQWEDGRIRLTNLYIRGEAAGSAPAYEEYHLSPGNTCRHSAVRITKDVSGRRDLGQGVSSQFFKKLPLTARMTESRHADDRSQFFYILPSPPDTWEFLPKHTQWIAERLYRRLDEMIMTQARNPLTMTKFEAVKALYNEVLEDRTGDILSILKGIGDWESRNQALIASHRKNHWFHFPTATENMFTELHQHFADVGVGSRYDLPGG